MANNWTIFKKKKKTFQAKKKAGAELKKKIEQFKEKKKKKKLFGPKIEKKDWKATNLKKNLWGQRWPIFKNKWAENKQKKSHNVRKIG